MATITGKGGVLRVGGRTAATLGQWVYEGTSKEWRVDAELLEHNAAWLRSGGLFELRLPMVQGGWRWTGVQPEAVGQGLIVRGNTRWEVYGVPGMKSG